MNSNTSKDQGPTKRRAYDKVSVNDHSDETRGSSNNNNSHAQEEEFELTDH